MRKGQNNTSLTRLKEQPERERERASYVIYNIIQKNMSIPQDMCTYPANGNGSWILDGRVETTSLHLFDVDVCEMDCKVHIPDFVLRPVRRG